MSSVRRLVLLVLVTGIGNQILYGQTCACNGFNDGRTEVGWSFVDGTWFSRARSNLANPAFFGPDGVVHRTIAIGGGMGTATEASLSSVNVFFTGKTPTSSYSSAERSAISNAVRNGMQLVILSDDPQHDLSDLFGVTLASPGGDVSSGVATDHPILAGPFGRLTQLTGADGYGHFRSWPSGTLLIASNSAGPSMILIPRGSIAAGAGAVLLLSDADMLTTVGRNLDVDRYRPSVPVTDALVMNIVAFLCDPTQAAVAPHLVFPQFANGEKNVSSLVLTNTEEERSAGATVTLKDDDGNPLSVNLVGLGSNSVFNTQLRPHETKTYKTDGVGVLRSGTVTVRGTPLLSGNVLFLLPGLGITGVGVSEVAGGFDLPVVPAPSLSESPPNIFTGLAVSNMSARSADVRLELWDASGRRGDGIATTSLPPFGHFAKFLYQVFPNFDFQRFTGTLRVVSSNTLLAVTALQLGSEAGQFSALPVKPLFR